MKIGKVSQTVLKRSILKPLKYRREDALFSPSVEEMCYGIKHDEEEEILVTSTVLYGREKNLGVFALAQVMNDLATRGSDPIGVSVQILLPPHAYESRLKSMIEYIEQEASTRQVQVLSAKAEVCPGIVYAMVQMTGMGTVRKGEILQSSMGKENQDLVLLNWVGFEGSLRILQEKEEELKTRFVPTFLSQMKRKQNALFAVDAIRTAKDHGACAMHQIGSGGVLAALWELAEASDVGLEVEMRKLSILQETVEICEYYHLNPYQMTSIGSILVVTERGQALVQRCQELGIQASLIGRTTGDNARILLGGEERRFLDRPGTDELLKIYEENQEAL